MRKLISAALVGLALAATSAAAHADDKKVVIAYQTGAVPYFVGIANGDLAKKTGWDIEFRRFNSGADIFAAIASGDVQIGDVGSSPFAAAVSRGIDVKAFYISVGLRRRRSPGGTARTSSRRPTCKGKKLAAAPVSTDHYQLLAVLKQEGISEKETQVIAIPQPRDRRGLEARRHRRRLRLGSGAVGTEEGRQGPAHLRPGRRARRADLQRAGRDRRFRQGAIPNSSASMLG